ncbi:hypothetical protein ACFVHB_10690 [Kitasatospora sp. NPDC127111]|uniref:hypothetical protein n=1 Tax=Kitasatospora sp. NPDC127111 TaxID=3345363 RepID=UPI003643116A
MPDLLPSVPRSPGPPTSGGAAIATPVGELEFSARIGAWSVPRRPQRAFRLPGGALVHRWEHASAELELLICSYEAEETEFTLPVAACWGAVWSVRARTALERVRLSASFRDVPADVRSDAAVGQAVAAVELWNAGTDLTLSGSDEEELCARAGAGDSLPRRWAALLDDVHRRSHPTWGVEYRPDHQGLTWALPPFAPGDHALLHAAVSWRTPLPDDPDDDTSTWWATILTQPRHLLAAAAAAAAAAASDR